MAILFIKFCIFVQFRLLTNKRVECISQIRLLFIQPSAQNDLF